MHLHRALPYPALRWIMGLQSVHVSCIAGTRGFCGVPLRPPWGAQRLPAVLL